MNQTQSLAHPVEAVPHKMPSLAAQLSPTQRKELAITMLGHAEPVTKLAQHHQVSRKFLYQHAHKAETALDEAFTIPSPDDQNVLFYLPITKAWIRMCVVGLLLICRSSYRGVIEFLRDLLDVHLSLGTVHNIITGVVPSAQRFNQTYDLSPVRIGVLDELYQGSQPVLAGTDHDSGYCFLLSGEAQRDADTWGIHLLDLRDQGLNPAYTIADQAKGLRTGQALAFPERACHGDVFHIVHDLERMAYGLERRAQGCLTTRQTLDRKMLQAKKKGRGNTLSKKLAMARTNEITSFELAQDVRVLVEWLRQDILSLAGPDLTTREALFDFVVTELTSLEVQCPHRIRPVRCALQNQRDDVLAFVTVLDDAFTTISDQYDVPRHLVHALCELSGLPEDSSLRWQREDHIRHHLGWKFFDVHHAVSVAMSSTPRTSSVIENFNSRLRNYFFLRKHLGPSYLDLLRFFLNHRTFLHTSRPERVGKSPAELLTGQSHAHWLELLGFSLFRRHSVTA